ncbi:gliding motility protein GldB-related protein [Mesonia maritima]|uniref:DUF2268 domain-containing protein n=1 Tax=Mesonia maritima TaxID=1793873 RepID=A0ABU1K4R6_9FLAO|nr:hypothetical protein [Mesonia maritima]MDR6300250.1 hypothetical protein [Mesonia maritima]
MKKISTLLILILIFTSCQTKGQTSKNIVAKDITNFWKAYDKINSTNDTIQQYEYLDKLFLEKGTLGLKAIIENRGYTAKEYLDAINNYPKFWASIRKNTLRTNEFSSDLETGREKLKKIYPDLKPAKIYFTIGALRTGGTTMDSLVLIGSEIAMTDKNTITSEFPTEIGTNRRKYFDSNPIDNLVLLNIHEYVHTQQKPIVHNLLSYCIYEGVAELVSVKAMNTKSSTPAIEYGRKNDKVRQKFEQEMFYGNNVNQWLWSDAENEFDVRDLGYYIGYQICELYYDQAKDKKSAIKKMIELDYSNETEIERFVNGTGFFSTSLEELYQNFEKKRPIVLGVKQFENNCKTVSPSIEQITIEFSKPLNGYNTGVDFGNLGQDAFPKNDIEGRFWSEDNTSWTIPVELEPNKTYQLLISNNFRTEENIPLKPYLIEFRTRNE